MFLSKVNKILIRKFFHSNLKILSCSIATNEANDSASFGFKQVKTEEKQEKG